MIKCALCPKDKVVAQIHKKGFSIYVCESCLKIFTGKQ